MLKHTWFLLLLYLSTINWSFAGNSTWADALRTKEADVNAFYTINEPFLFTNHSSQLNGIEYEVVQGFESYIESRYGVKININWKEKDTQKDVLKEVELNRSTNTFGIGNISWTKERHQRLSFSTPYFPDILVLVSHRNNPSANSIEEFSSEYSKASAITVKGSTSERHLFQLRKKSDINFNTFHISKNRNLIHEILQSKKSFGYVDITSYLLALEKDLPIKRLSLHPTIGKGIGIVFNKNSDWSTPINEYLTSPEFKEVETKIIQTYLGHDFEDFVHKLSISNDHDKEFVMLLLEKKFMDMELNKMDHEVAIQNQIRNILIITVIIVLIITYFLYNQSKIKSNTNEVLMLHRKMIESQNRLLSKRNEELTEVNEEKNNFIHILSHDLRAPINNINGLTKLLLLDKKNINEEQIKMISHISSESLRLNKMVTRILDIERIESETVDEYIKINLNEVVENVIKNFETESAKKEITIITQVENNIYALGISQYFFHIFENLLSNALKFSPIGETVIVRLSKENEITSFQVIDNGPGMTEDDKAKMFKKFQVLTARATAGERSTGLGLSIVNKYIGLLEGELKCDSIVGNGTTFTASFKEFKEEQLEANKS